MLITPIMSSHFILLWSSGRRIDDSSCSFESTAQTHTVLCQVLQTLNILMTYHIKNVDMRSHQSCRPSVHFKCHASRMQIKEMNLYNLKYGREKDQLNVQLKEPLAPFRPRAATHLLGVWLVERHFGGECARSPPPLYPPILNPRPLAPQKPAAGQRMVNVP